jgi:monoamine oxidase
MTGQHHICDTLIIGAGLAGISAARTIEAHNRSQAGGAAVTYTVLEAGDKIGGRVQTEKRSVAGNPHDVIINPGAQWLHADVRADTPENPLLKHVRDEYKMPLVHDDMPRVFYDRGFPTRYNPSIQRINTARRVIDNFQGPDTDLATLFNETNLGTPSSLATTFGEVETGAPLHQVSAVDVRELVACNRGEFTKEGLATFVDKFAEDVKPNIKLNSAVKKVSWQPNGREGVVIETANGDTYHAKRCVMTTSVGVLKSGAIAFDPPLPPAHAESLSHINMGNFNKIFLFFDKEFKFPVNHNTHMDVRTKSGDDVFYLARDNGQQLVTTFLGGELGQLCDRDPDAARELAIQGLAEIWGDQVRGHIVDTRVTQWGNDPLVRGGYSRVEVGHHHVRQQLAEPIGGVLYLAGEAMGTINRESGRNWATHMAGAALSGERAAREVLQSLDRGTAVAAARADASMTRFVS